MTGMNLSNFHWWVCKHISSMHSVAMISFKKNNKREKTCNPETIQLLGEL